MNDTQIQARAEEIARTFGLPSDWKVKIVGTREIGNDYGRCNYIGKQIKIRRLRINARWSFFHSTVLHEVAHALTPGALHGPIWDAKFTELLRAARPKDSLQDTQTRPLVDALIS